MNSPYILLFAFFIITITTGFNDLLCTARDSINSKTPLNQNETLVSAGNIFQLGFFGNNNAYVGIWYFGKNPTTIVWVHDIHMSDSFGIVDGRFEIWSGTDSNKTLQLLDSGNLILLDGNARSWESFSYPTDTFLPGMKMDENLKLTSWKSPSNPSPGDFTFKQQQGGSQSVYMVQNRSVVYWKSGSFSKSFDLIPIFIVQLFSSSSRLTGGMISQNRFGSRTLNYTTPSVSNETERLFMNSSGQIQYYRWNNTSNMWHVIWSEPQDQCSLYNYCGSFSICNTRRNPICSCLSGYNRSPDSQGCERRSVCHPGKDTFSDLALMKVEWNPLPYESATSNEKCKEECSNNCKCRAYSYIADTTVQRGSGSVAAKCLIWSSDLINLENNDQMNGFNISLRVPQSEVAEPLQPFSEQFAGSGNTFQNRYLVGFIVSFLGVVLVFCSCFVFYQRRMIKRNGNQNGTDQNPVLFSYESETQITEFMLEHEKGIDVPFFSFRDILSATENFSDANKLGRGGFGPVYKGIFPGGQEFAVKRLSSCSGQGIEEFRNEVILIAKLQHRNLVRLLGYSVTENEKILLYEYMSNRSLDAFIFDQRNSLLLDWKKRFDIILEIARGLLYLHQDSRLRIIHRDLKTSNILLDGEMNAKISDFGLARIVEGKGTEASTNKIVGTYGYMSPEYAMDGKFSFKSDVFSFGVVVLEIINGKRNTGFSQSQDAANLLGYAWGLWSENKALDLVDPALRLSCDEPQVVKCINLALLCVQEDPNDRPTMSTVIAMLSSETNVLPFPLQPAFIVRKRISSISSSASSKPDTISENMLTIEFICFSNQAPQAFELHKAK